MDLWKVNKLNRTEYTTGSPATNNSLQETGRKSQEMVGKWSEIRCRWYTNWVNQSQGILRQCTENASCRNLFK